MEFIHRFPYIFGFQMKSNYYNLTILFGGLIFHKLLWKLNEGISIIRDKSLRDVY